MTRPRHETAPGRRRLVRLTARAVALLSVVAALSASGDGMARRDVIGGLAFVDEIDVTVVNIDVLVRDRADRVVTDLKREDFRLLIDGQERPLSNFAAYTEQAIADAAVSQPPGGAAFPAPTAVTGVEDPGPAAAAGEIPIQPVHVVLFVDNENLRPMDRNRVLPQVLRFVRTIMLPHVRVMVVSAERSVRVVQGFTAEIREVEAALRSLRRVSGGRADDDRTRNRLIRDIQKIEDQKMSSGGRVDPRDAMLAEEMIRSYGEEVAFELDYTAAGMREITASLAGLPGRKVMIHVSNGLPMIAARDLVMWWGEIFQQRPSLPMLSRFNRSALYESLAAAANAQGVSLYTVDASGVSGTAGASAEFSRPLDPMVSTNYTINHQQPLQYLAEATGGRAILDSNDVADDLARLRADLFTYYSLGFDLSAAGGDTVHRLEVELPNHPEHRLLYRQTFVEKSLESRVQDEVVSSLVLEVESNAMGIAVVTGTPRPTSGDRWLLPVEISFPIESVALLPEQGDYVGRVVAYLATRNIVGRQSEIQRREFEIRMPAADYEERGGEHFTASFDLLMEEGVHRIVVGILDPLTRQSSYARTLQAVPEGGGQ